MNNLQEKNKKYYEENKEKLQEKYKARVHCPLCNSEVSHGSLNAHMKSKLCAKRFEIRKKLRE